MILMVLTIHYIPPILSSSPKYYGLTSVTCLTGFSEYTVPINFIFFGSDLGSREYELCTHCVKFHSDSFEFTL